MAARMQGLKRFVAMIAAIAVCLVLHTGAALADERLCRQLEAQLAALSPGGGGGAQYRKYDKAIATQRDQLRQARGRARASGCGFSLFGGGGGSGCARLNRTIDRMERNLSALQSKRTQLAGAGGMKRQRNRLLASLDANGCRDTRAQQGEARRSLEQTSRGMTLFDRLFNGGVRPLEELEAEIPDNVRRVPSDEWQASGGQYRTLCVRTCDGYYFPISPSSSMRDFDRDQQNCEAMCPGTEAQIYYQDAAEESAETMLSTATGAALCGSADGLSLPTGAAGPMRVQPGQKLLDHRGNAAGRRIAGDRPRCRNRCRTAHRGQHNHVWRGAGQPCVGTAPTG